MTEAGGDQPFEGGSKPPSSEKLPRAHKRCVNKDCREVLSLATKYCKKCNAVQFERRVVRKQDKRSGKKRKSVEGGGGGADSTSLSEEDEQDGEEEEEGEGGEDGEEREEEEEDEEEEEEEEEDEGRAQSSPTQANIPHATNYAIQHTQEAWDREAFDCGRGPDKPMVELVAGTRVYYQASIVRETKNEIRLLFPGTKSTKQSIEWVDKRSSRIWRGRMESRYWRYIKGSDGGWEPKTMGESTAAGSFRRRGSGRSRGSAGVTRSRGTKQSTEDGTDRKSVV